MISVSQLFIYPVKSLAGIEVDHALLTDRGLQHDRRFMLVDSNNIFLTQREYPVMALLKTLIRGDKLRVWHKDNPSDAVEIPLTPVLSTALITATVWDDQCQAQLVDSAIDGWFTSKLGMQCKLVYMPETTHRKVDPDFARNGDITSFSDGYPLLVIGQASLDDLNGRLTEQLSMNRFRPSIVVSGSSAFDEDSWDEFSINGIRLNGVKLCARCVVTTTNQETGITGKEPLRTLSKYRSLNNKIYFGQNVLCGGQGSIRVGDEVDVLKRKQAIL